MVPRRDAPLSHPSAAVPPNPGGIDSSQKNVAKHLADMGAMATFVEDRRRLGNSNKFDCSRLALSL